MSAFFTWLISSKHVVAMLIRITVLIYIVSFAVGLLLINKLMFPAPSPSYSDSEKILKLSSPAGASIAARLLENPTARHTLLVSHGNGEDLGHGLAFAKDLQKAGFQVMLYDYTGYGLTSGKPSEKSVYDAAEAAIQELMRRGIKPERILLYGRSIGSGPSVELATRYPVAGLITEAAFTSIVIVVTKINLFPVDRFRNLKKIGRVDCPVFIMHGTEDEVTPFSHGEKLFAAANEPKRKRWVEGAGHDDVIQSAGPEIFAEIKAFADSLKH